MSCERREMWWTLMFRVDTREQAERELAIASELSGLSLQPGVCERYYKIPELWRCTATAAFTAGSVAEQVTQSLLIANRLGIGWYCLGPYLRDDGTLEHFEGIYNMSGSNTKMPGLEWANFEVDCTPRDAS
jgi:hypothetical protein